MNEAGVFHCDLKSANILAREEDGILYTRLIDWGLSTVYKNGDTIPKILTNRPFQYNVPFSNIIFTSLFKKMYNAFLEKNSNPDYYAVRTFVINYVIEWVEKRGPGHLKTMNNIFQNLFEQDLKITEATFKGELIEYDYTFYFIFEYITKILVKFTKNGKFNVMDYFREVFTKNIDIWGFVVSYVPIVEDIINTHKKITPIQLNILNKIKQLMLILIESSDHPVDVNALIENLKDLNSVFTNITHKKLRPVHSSSSSSSLPKKEMMDELNSTEKKALYAGSVSSGTRKKVKKRHFHKMIVKTLKNIKSLHSKGEWI
jgi:serine/threonine protein kinase